MKIKQEKDLSGTHRREEQKGFESNGGKMAGISNKQNQNNKFTELSKNLKLKKASDSSISE